MHCPVHFNTITSFILTYQHEITKQVDLKYIVDGATKTETFLNCKRNASQNSYAFYHNVVLV